MDRLQERRRRIVETLARLPLATVSDLSRETNVSKETIRKDLAALEEAGVVERIHGGAALASREASGNLPYERREGVHSAEKLRIAHAARALIAPGDAVLLEGSTTGTALGHALAEAPELLQTLTVVTNSIHIVELLRFGRLCQRLLCLGGWLSPEEGTAGGALLLDQLAQVHVDKAFISGAALNRDLELFAHFEDDMRFQRQAIASAETAVLMVDSGKYPASGVLSVGSAADFSHLVTDIDFDPPALERLERAKTALVRV